MSMRKRLNAPVLVSVVLLGLVLLSSHYIFHMFARYTTKAEGGDAAHAASFTLISIHEHEAQRQADGSYQLTDDEVTENSYVLLPGLDIPKDPFIRVKSKPEVKSYLYTEIVSTLGDKLSYIVDEKWTQLDGVTGSHGGAVYVYDVAADFGGEDINILKDQTVTVSDTLYTAYSDAKSDTGTEPQAKLSLYGYIIQRSPDLDYTELFENTFVG